MDTHLKEFKQTWQNNSKAIALLEDAYITSTKNYNADYSRSVLTFNYSCCVFSSFENMSQFSQKVSSIKISREGPHITKLSFGHESLRSALENVTLGAKTTLALPESNKFSNIELKYLAETIEHPPLEVLHLDRTYRILTGKTASGTALIALISSDQDPIYNYLDKGYSVKFIKTEFGRKVIVTDNYTQHAAKIFAMCELDPSLTTLLQDECFLHSSTDQIICLKMEKRLGEEQKLVYNRIKNEVEKAYVGAIKNDAIKKFLDYKLDKLELNNITFTKTSATYQNISIEAKDLLARVRSIFTHDELDIYTVIDKYAESIQTDIDGYKRAQINETITIANIKVNGMAIPVQLKKGNRRFINNISIFKDDVAKILARSSCYRDIKQYNLFLRSVHNRSLEDHDIVANGFRVKIHYMTHSEYCTATPSETAPRIKFRVDPTDDKIKLEISKDRLIAVNFKKLINRLKFLNTKTNNKFLRNWAWLGGRSYTKKDCEWAKAKVIEAILEFKAADEIVTSRDLTDLLFDIMQINHTALRKSEEFLASAIKTTGAEEIRFKGEIAYKVKGSLREYVVIKSSAKVYDFDTGQYRCIVNDTHYVGAGYDDIAARLLMLKNDSVMQKTVVTLKGEAQPQYETHYYYTPDRGDDANILAIADGFVKA